MKSSITPAVISLVLSAPGFAQCNIHRFGVPDFDQKRWGLDENNGSMHCVPTSSLNWMGYLANHGFPNAMGYSSSNWASSSNYNHVTNRVEVMGDLSDTNYLLSTGTSLGDGVEGIVDYLDEYNVGLYAIVYGYKAHDSWAPSPKMMYNQMKAGYLVNFCYGRYDLDGSEWERDGGHCMTLVAVEDACGNNPKLKFHNPNTSDSIYSQSAFSTDSWITSKFTANFEGDVRGQWQKVGSAGTTSRKFIDRVISIFPNFGFSLPPARANGIQLHRLSFLTNEPQQEQETILTPDNAPVITAIPFARDPGAFVITRGVDREHPSKLYFYDLVERTWNPLETFATDPLGALQDRFGNLYINFGDSIQKYVVGDGSVRPISSLTPRYPIDAMTLNDATDDLHLLSSDAGHILTYPLGNLGGDPLDRRLPPGVELPGAPLLCYHPKLQRIYLTSGDARSIWGIDPGAAAPDWVIGDAMAVPAGSEGILSIHFTDKGIIAIHSRNGYEEFDREPTAGRLVPTATPLFRGRQISGFLHMLRSQHDFDPRTETVRQWHSLDNPEVDAESQVECRGDFNFDGVVDFFDYLDFVQVFADGNMNADFDVDGTIDFFDYLEFLEAFNERC